MKLKIGDRAPDFEVNNQDGEIVKLSDYKGKKVVLYFYPKDQTPGCIGESCNLRDNYNVLLKEGFIVLGISKDSEKSHLNFIKKQDLPFPLLADTELVVHNLYGTWAEKKMYGRTYMGTLRTTFIIDENGDIADIIEKVKTKDHTAQILK
jgi:thioredoxin-dependent peroxiredoxin